MSSRESILAAVLKNQPPLTPLPDISIFKVHEPDLKGKYMDLFNEIGGFACAVQDFDEIKTKIKSAFDTSKRIITTLPALHDIAESCSPSVEPHNYEDVELAIIQARLAVAENGAVWLTEEVMGQRIIPYISQHLVVIVRESDIVSTMHDAYARIASEDYGFGGFIGGPSKTADIEQALVLGAHGPLSMTVYVIK